MWLFRVLAPDTVACCWGDVACCWGRCGVRLASGGDCAGLLGADKGFKLITWSLLVPKSVENPIGDQLMSSRGGRLWVTWGDHGLGGGAGLLGA